MMLGFTENGRFSEKIRPNTPPSSPPIRPAARVEAWAATTDPGAPQAMNPLRLAIA
jgi:hypothetical protein